MSLPVVYLSEAQDDVEAAYTGYEQRQVSLRKKKLSGTDITSRFMRIIGS